MQILDQDLSLVIVYLTSGLPKTFAGHLAIFCSSRVLFKIRDCLRSFSLIPLRLRFLIKVSSSLGRLKKLHLVLGRTVECTGHESCSLVHLRFLLGSTSTSYKTKANIKNVHLTISASHTSSSLSDFTLCFLFFPDGCGDRSFSLSLDPQLISSLLSCCLSYKCRTYFSESSHRGMSGVGVGCSKHGPI